MRRKTLFTGLLGLVLAAALCQFTPALHAQNQSGYASAQQQSSQQEIQTFTGTIRLLENGNYALITGETPEGRSGHLLDDAEEAAKFEDQEVEVTGTLDVASNTIHVMDIQSV